MPAKDRPPSFQFYPREWIVDTRHMTRDQRDRYHEAMCESWLSESYGEATENQWRVWLGYSEEEWSHSARTAFAQRFKIRGTKWIQVMMSETRRSQVRRYGQAKAGADKTNAQRPHSARTATAPASASALQIESKDRTVASAGPSAGCMKRLASRFPSLDLPVIEAKMLAYHARNPYKSLDLAMVNWCKKAEVNGWDAREDPQSNGAGDAKPHGLPTYTPEEERAPNPEALARVRGLVSEVVAKIGSA